MQLELNCTRPLISAIARFRDLVPKRHNVHIRRVDNDPGLPGLCSAAPISRLVVALHIPLSDKVVFVRLRPLLCVINIVVGLNLHICSRRSTCYGATVHVVPDRVDSMP